MLRQFQILQHFLHIPRIQEVYFSGCYGNTSFYRQLQNVFQPNQTYKQQIQAICTIYLYIVTDQNMTAYKKQRYDATDGEAMEQRKKYA